VCPQQFKKQTIEGSLHCLLCGLKLENRQDAHCLRTLLTHIAYAHCLRTLLTHIAYAHCLRTLLTHIAYAHCLRTLLTHIAYAHCLRTLLTRLCSNISARAHAPERRAFSLKLTRLVCQSCTPIALLLLSLLEPPWAHKGTALVSILL